MIMENNDVQLLKRARHAFKNLIIYGPRPVVRPGSSFQQTGATETSPGPWVSRGV